MNQFVRGCWLCIAIALEYGSRIGGDASIFYGWIILIWTAPFSMMFQFYFYDFYLRYMPSPVAQLVGSASEVIFSYLFWFILIPTIWRKRKKSVTK
ncbi:hypothetical protein [Rugamonas sp.]|uniref:hypothetical protein n=1 Tax=Rugamonas sp. TaxID=1926287 RepID=UPI0025EF2027|nr:hypothetical protein [Rugamonas sp.]